MVIYDLVCVLGHEFEGWFKNPDDLGQQQAAGLLCCPACDSAKVSKKLTAAKLTRKSNVSRAAGSFKDGKSVPGAGTPATSSDLASAISGSEAGANSDAKAYAKVQKMLAKVHDYVEANFEDVGNRFAEEAISMHKGEKDVTNIRGTATKDDLENLAEEGVSAVPLPAKPVDKKKLN